MPAAKVTAKDRERFDRARARGEARAQDPSAIVEARCDTARDAIDLGFRSGGVMTIPAARLFLASRRYRRRPSTPSASRPPEMPVLAIAGRGRVRAQPRGAGVRHAVVCAGDGTARRPTALEGQGRRGTCQRGQGWAATQASDRIGLEMRRQVWVERRRATPPPARQHTRAMDHSSRNGDTTERALVLSPR